MLTNKVMTTRVSLSFLGCLYATLIESPLAVRVVVDRTSSNGGSEVDSTGCDLSRYHWGNRFTDVKYAGAGANGCVVLAKDNHNGGVKVAIKVSKRPGKLSSWQKECEKTKAFHKAACKAGKLQKQLSERFLPNCLEVGGSNEAPFIIMHAAGGEGIGNKDKLLKSVPREERLSVFAQIIGALTSLHGIGYAHNDLHTKNVVFLSKGVPTKIAFIDFGSIRTLETSHYEGNYKQDEKLVMSRAVQLANCPDDTSTANTLVCLRKAWSPHGADEEFFNVLSKVFDEAAKRQQPLNVPVLFKTAFIQKHLPKLERLFPNTECGTSDEPRTDTEVSKPSVPDNTESSVKKTSYEKHAGKNCYPSTGAKSGEGQSAPTGLSLEACQERCDSDTQCNCVVFAAGSGKCWKRKDCAPNKCHDAHWADTYVESA